MSTRFLLRLTEKMAPSWVENCNFMCTHQFVEIVWSSIFMAALNFILYMDGLPLPWTWYAFLVETLLVMGLINMLLLQFSLGEVRCFQCLNGDEDEDEDDYEFDMKCEEIKEYIKCMRFIRVF